MTAPPFALAMRSSTPVVFARWAIQYELGFVVQFVDDDVVAAAEVHRAGHDVLAFARGEEEADFVRARVDQRAYCARTALVFLSMSPSAIGA